MSNNQGDSPTRISHPQTSSIPVTTPLNSEENDSGRFPSTIGGYQILRKIGEGGMGIVLLGFDTTLKRSVAIKLIRSEMASDEIFIQCCLGLEAAARRGIVHRDIKPSNILISEENVVKIMDFGLSKQARGNVATMSSSVMGTPDYMAPEQAAGKETDFRSDIYSLGISLFQCLTGELPFRSSSIFETIRMHAQDPLPEKESLKRLCHGKLFELLTFMTAKEAANRPKSYRLVREQLSDFLKELSTENASPEMPLHLEVSNDQQLYAETACVTGEKEKSRVTTSPPEKDAKSKGKKKKNKLIFAAIVLLTLTVALVYITLSGNVSIQLNTVTEDDREVLQPDPSGEESLTPVPHHRVAKGPVTFSTTRHNTATAASLLADLGSFGANQSLAPNLPGGQTPVSASFTERTAVDVMNIICFAMGWTVEEENGISYISGASTPTDSMKDLRSELDVNTIPKLSINTINQAITLRMFCDKVSHDCDYDYLIIGLEPSRVSLPAFSFTQMRLDSLLDFINKESNHFTWTIHNGTLIILPAS